MAKKRTQRKSDIGLVRKDAAGPRDLEVAVPIERSFPEGQVGVLANHFVIQRDGPEFHLLFFQTHPPLVFAETDEECRKLLAAAKAKSVCVARIVVSAERLPSFIAAMETNLERYGREGRSGEDGAGFSGDEQ